MCPMRKVSWKISRRGHLHHSAPFPRQDTKGSTWFTLHSLRSHAGRKYYLHWLICHLWHHDWAVLCCDYHPERIGVRTDVFRHQERDKKKNSYVLQKTVLRTWAAGAGADAWYWTCGWTCFTTSRSRYSIFGTFMKYIVCVCNITYT